MADWQSNFRQRIHLILIMKPYKHNRVTTRKPSKRSMRQKGVIGERKRLNRKVNMKEKNYMNKVFFAKFFFPGFKN